MRKTKSLHVKLKTTFLHVLKNKKMRQEHILQRDTYRVMNTFFSQYPDITASTPDLKEAVATFQENFKALDDTIADEKTLKTVSAADRLALKTKIAQNIRKAFDKIVVQAVKDKDKEAKAACNTSLSMMVRASEADFLDLTASAMTLLSKNTALLDKVGMNEAFRTELSQDIKVYDNMKPIMESERKKTRVFRGNQTEMFDELQEYIDIVLRDAIDGVNAQYPNFVKEYNAMCVGKTPTSSPTKLVILTVDETDKPLSAVDIALLEMATTISTNELGKLDIKMGGIKTVTLKATKTGFIEKETHVTNIKRGQTTEVLVKMEKQQ